ncbi:SagB/ThcOx family dehydrogenase [Bacillus cereus]|nr:SagB/ThcOx family dehydrogenase [Bacillus cereus]
MKIKQSSGLMVLNKLNNLEVYDSISLQRWTEEMLNQETLVSLLSFCNEWREEREVIELISSENKVGENIAKDSLDELLSLGLLITEENQNHNYTGEHGEHWLGKGWKEPFVYHFHTNKIPKDDYSLDPKGLDDKASMKKYLSEENPPDNYKVISGPSIELLKDEKLEHKSLTTIFNDHVGMYRDSGALSFQEFSRLMYLSFGETSKRKLPVTGDHIAKTVPSGGSRHPSEIYTIISDVEGIDMGLYHYDVKNHALTLIKEGDYREFVQEHIITHPERPNFKVNVCFVFSTIFDRSMYRYRESRSYRVMQYDLGHLMQNLAFISSSLDRSSYRGYSLHDSKVDEFLGIDGLMESTMTFALIG